MLVKCLRPKLKDQSLMDLWIIFLLLAVACFLIGIIVSANKNQALASQKSAVALQAYDPNLQREITMPSDISLPAEWNEASITRQLQQLRDQRPALIPHFVESVKERWILRQDDHTAEVRLQFLKTQIEQLKLVKEFQQTAHDIELLLLEKTKRVKTLELETQELDVKRRSLTRKEEIEATRDQKRLELEIAELDQKIQAIKNPPAPDPVQPTPRQPSIEEQIAAQEAKIKRYERESADRQKSAGSPPEAQKWKVFYEDLINDAQEELKKLLRRR